MRILLVDDDPKLARALAKGLGAHGYAVDVAADSDAALLHTAVYDYDVVLLDVMLPGRDGFVVCRTLREHGIAAPVLMLTARDAVDASAGSTRAPTTTCRSRSTAASCSPASARSCGARRPNASPSCAPVRWWSIRQRTRRRSTAARSS
jgi:CheY-like chemotaxis protein